MKSVNPRMLVIGLLMFAGAGLAVAMKPTHKIADARERPDLHAMIPQQIGEWKIDTSIVPIEPSPEVQAKLDKIYNQTLARTYINSRGQRVMLSIAYGGDQSDGMNVHRPEVCYTAQGFEVISGAAAHVVTDYGVLPVKRLVARQGARNEPITYWIVVGDRVATRVLEQKLAQLRYGLTGKVPDGMLVRLSTIDRDESRSFAVQEEFLRGLLGALGGEQRSRVAGTFGA